MFVLFSDKMPFKGKDDAEKDAATVAGEIEFSHGEPDDLQKIIKDLCTIDMSQRTKGVEQLKKHAYFNGFDWARLAGGGMEAMVKPNVNDINAPSKNEIAAFKKPKDVEWTSDDQSAFASWDYMDQELWYDEAMFRVRKFKEIPPPGGGGGGCCTIA